MTPFRSESLGVDHETGSFHSGEPELDRWLQVSALHAQTMGTARTFIWHQGDNLVVAYFSLAAHLIAREQLSNKIGRGSPDHVPAVLLARLALDRSLQGVGSGGELLHDALARAAKAAESVGVRVVVVDAIDERAAAFYEHLHFEPLPGNPFRLARKMSDIARALGAR